MKMLISLIKTSYYIIEQGSRSTLIGLKVCLPKVLAKSIPMDLRESVFKSMIMEIKYFESGFFVNNRSESLSETLNSFLI